MHGQALDGVRGLRPRLCLRLCLRLRLRLQYGDGERIDGVSARGQRVTFADARPVPYELRDQREGRALGDRVGPDLEDTRARSRALEDLAEQPSLAHAGGAADDRGARERLLEGLLEQRPERGELSVAADQPASRSGLPVCTRASGAVPLVSIVEGEHEPRGVLGDEDPTAQQRREVLVHADSARERVGARAAREERGAPLDDLAHGHRPVEVATPGDRREPERGLDLSHGERTASGGHGLLAGLVCVVDPHDHRAVGERDDLPAVGLRRRPKAARHVGFAGRDRRSCRHGERGCGEHQAQHALLSLGERRWAHARRAALRRLAQRAQGLAQRASVGGAPGRILGQAPHHQRADGVGEARAALTHVAGRVHEDGRQHGH